MKSLLVYLKKYRKESILAPLFKMLEATFELLVPLVMAAVIDTGIRNHDRHYVISMCLVLVLLGVVGLAASITAQYFAAKAATGFAGALRHALFDKIQSLTFSQMDTFGTDTLITRLTSDVNQVQNGVNLFLRLFLRSPFVVFGAMIMAFTVDARSAMLFVITIPILSVVIFGIMLTRENLTGVRVIRAFRKESDETRRFRENNRTLAASQKFVGRISGLMNPVTYVIINLSTCALIYVGAVRIDTGILKAGQVVALLNYMSQILIELIKLANLIIQMTKAAACGDRIAAVLAVQPDMENGEQKLSAVEDDGPAVAFRDVSLSYKGSAGRALEHISFEARKGQTVGIIGGTGSGKSSLVNLIPRFYDVSEGEVDVFGIDVRKLDAASLRDHVGIVLQKAELEQALEASQAKEYVDKKPGGVGYMLEQNGRNLSGGQRQRLTIARALIKKPDILILDDSASALDFATDAKLRMAIRKMSHSMTTFIVSQRAASVQYADLILVLDDGKLVGKGTHEELLRSNEVYQEIYYSQFPKEAAHA